MMGIHDTMYYDFWNTIGMFKHTDQNEDQQKKSDKNDQKKEEDKEIQKTDDEMNHVNPTTLPLF